MCRYYSSGSGGYVRMCYKTKRAGYHLGVERIKILPPTCREQVERQIAQAKKEKEEGENNDSQ